jgi:glycine cleavage system pyridoxal-binding protein P
VSVRARSRRWRRRDATTPRRRRRAPHAVSTPSRETHDARSQVKSDDAGNIDLDDFKAKAEKHKDNLSAIMVTYPSTYGVFEETITDLTRITHECGGQVYMDGANLNARSRRLEV